MKDSRGIGLFTASPGMGKSFALRRPVHEALRQRITVHYNFTGLDDSEAAQYISHKIICAGGAPSIIDAAALSSVHSHSNGNPRLIDNLITDLSRSVRRWIKRSLMRKLFWRLSRAKT